VREESTLVGDYYLTFGRRNVSRRMVELAVISRANLEG
jgi:hypothetical protein